MIMNDRLLHHLKTLLGASSVRSSSWGDDTEAWEQDQRRRLQGELQGRARAVVFPHNVEQVQAVVRACVEDNVPIVPQGGNTGLVLGGTPTAQGNEIVINLSRLKALRSVDVMNHSMTVEAGCTLAQVQLFAREAKKIFPLSMASEGTCTLGGNLATNAGGTAVLAFGNARQLCLGLEVITAEGELWSSLVGLRKDNSGYDLRDLFIGSEGTLGIITAATLMLFPAPISQHTAWVSMSSLAQVMAFFARAQAQGSRRLVGFELMNDVSINLVRQHFSHFEIPFNPAPWQVLIECHESESVEHGNALMETLLESAFTYGEIVEGTMARNEKQSKQLWAIRESIPLAQSREGLNIKHDISLPISAMEDFVTNCQAALIQAFPGVRVVNFGHVGDGNLHFNVQAPIDVDSATFLAQYEMDINRLIYDRVCALGGSISAEHGIGRLKTEWLKRYQSPIAREMMLRIKQTLDPKNLMNPYRIF